MSTEAELQERYQTWVDAVLAGGEVWTIGNGEHNRVIEDPHEERDLHVLFSSRADAERQLDDGDEVQEPLRLDTFPQVLDRVDARGEGLALWHGDRWVVADPAPLAVELRERA